MENLNQIKRAIAAGKTDRALELLLEYTENNNSPRHRDALLLSGQFQQWKREKALGAQQSGTELRRIEMAIMDILDEKTRASTAPVPPPPPQTTVHPRATPPTGIPSPSGSKPGFWKPWMSGVAVFLVLVVLLIWIGGDEEDASGNDSSQTVVAAPGENPTTDPGLKTPKGINTEARLFTFKFEGETILFRHHPDDFWTEELQDGTILGEFREIDRNGNTAILFNEEQKLTVKPNFATKDLEIKADGREPVLTSMIQSFEEIPIHLQRTVFWSGEDGEYYLTRRQGDTWIYAYPNEENNYIEFTEIERNMDHIILQNGTFADEKFKLVPAERKIYVTEKGQEYRFHANITDAY